MTDVPEMHRSRVRVNWTIPAPVILAILGQAVLIAFAIATWKTSIEGTISLLDKRIAMLEQLSANNTMISERVKGVEVKIEVIQNQTQNIESKIDKLIDRGVRR